MRDDLRSNWPTPSRRDLIRLGTATFSLIIHGARSAIGRGSGPAIATNTRDVLGLRERRNKNLKRIGLAMHDYHLAHGHFPPAALTGSYGEPLLSWRVAILPYLGHRDLYERFNLAEAWDGPFNRRLLCEIPEVYTPAGRGTERRHVTDYRGFVGVGAFFEGRRVIRLADITDGTVNTLMVVEATEPVAWTKPEGLSLAGGDSLPGVGSRFEEGFHALSCDGWVHFLDKGIDAEQLRRAVTRNDGEMIKLSWLRR
jgi:hypothetical protein